MYTKVVIDNFRCFEHLEVGPLARVNLITGANNVGKTALLEALYIYANANDPLVFSHTNDWRGIPPNIPHVAKDVRSYLLGFDPTREAAIATEADDSQSRTLSLRAEEIPPLAPIVQYGSAPPRRVEPADSDRWYQLTVKLSLGTHGQVSFSSSVFPGDLSSAKPLSLFLPARGCLSMEDDAARLVSLSVGQSRGIIDACRCLEPRLRGLSTLTPGPPMIYADLGGPELMPVPLFGEGFGHLLSMALAVTSTSSSLAGYRVLLIDEIENGIYHKAMPDVWRGLAHAAREFDVQLFATTHSWECVKAATEAFRDDFADDLHLHRLDRLDDGTIKATTYESDVLRDAVALNMEVR